MTTHVSRALAAAAISGVAVFSAWGGTAIAHADPVDTINLTDVTDIASLPVCVQEDCSDRPGQVGVWLDKGTGNWYLERGEDYTRVIMDDTVTSGAYLGPDTVGSDPRDDIATGPNAFDAGAYVGGWN